MVVYPDKPKSWQLINRAPNHEAEQEAIAVFESLDKFTGLDFHIDPTTSLPYLLFSEDAQILADQWRVRLEERLLIGESSPIFQAHLSKYRSLMPSLALIFALITSPTCTSKKIDIENIRMAIAWCEFLESHAKKVYEKVLNEEKSYAFALAEKNRRKTYL